MKKSILTVGLLAFALSLFAVTAAYSEDKAAAMIVKVTGTVKVKRGAKEVAVTGKVSLKLGDKVTASGGGSALVLFANGKKVTVTSTLDITEANSAIDAKNTSVAAGISGSVVGGSGKNKDLKSKGGGVGGATRAAAPTAYVQILSVPNTNTTNTRPVFAWETSAPADSSTVELMNENGDILWTTKTKDTIAAWPKEKEPLKSESEYTLNVKSVIDGDEAEMSTTFFVVDDEQAEAVKKATDAVKKEYAEGDDILIQHLLLAEYYKQKELYMDAVSELKKLIAIDANDIESRRSLMEIYIKTGNSIEAQKERLVIEKLEKDLGDAPQF